MIVWRVWKSLSSLLAAHGAITPSVCLCLCLWARLPLVMTPRTFWASCSAGIYIQYRTVLCSEFSARHRQSSNQGVFKKSTQQQTHQRLWTAETRSARVRVQDSCPVQSTWVILLLSASCQFDFVKLLDGKALPRSLTDPVLNVKAPKGLLLNGLQETGFIEYMDPGTWHLALYNDGRNLEQVVLHSSPIGEQTVLKPWFPACCRTWSSWAFFVHLA